MTKTVPLLSMMSILLSCSLSACSHGKVEQPNELSKNASDYLNQYYPNEFDYYDDFIGEGFRKTTRFRHKQDPNFILVLQGGETQNCMDYPSQCQAIVRSKYERSQRIANSISAVNQALTACQIPILEVLTSSVMDSMPTFVVELPINNTALARLHQCLMPAYPAPDEHYYQGFALQLIAPSAAPSPVRTVGIFEKTHPKTQTDPVYLAYLTKNQVPVLDKLTLAHYAPFTDRTKKAMIDEARHYLAKTKQGHIGGTKMFDPFTSDLVFNPANLDEYHLYIEACSQPPKRDSQTKLTYCSDSAMSLKYNAKTGKFYDHQWISTPNQSINLLFDLPKPF